MRKKNKRECRKDGVITLNITPLLLKVALPIIMCFGMYLFDFYSRWGMLPYVGGYTIFWLKSSEEEYGYGKGRLLILSRDLDNGKELYIEKFEDEFRVNSEYTGWTVGSVVCDFRGVLDLGLKAEELGYDFYKWWENYLSEYADSQLEE